MKTLRRMLGIRWQEHRTNESILQETGYSRQLVNVIKKRKLQYAGHVMRKAESLEKTIIQGSVPGRRGKGRPRKSWMDDLKEWTGLDVQQINKIAINRN